jgi:hypothetical protein
VEVEGQDVSGLGVGVGVEGQAVSGPGMGVEGQGVWPRLGVE